MQRVSVQNPGPDGRVSVTVSFDDTPGLTDTKFADRGVNEDLVRRYGEEYYPKMHSSDKPGLSTRKKTCPNLEAIEDWVRQYDEEHPDMVPSRKSGSSIRDTYPNIILLVISWDSVKIDHSSIRKTIHYLAQSYLVDEERQNVIVVVTKSLTYWNDYEDFSPQRDKDKEWQVDVDLKTRIINDLRSELFMSSISWPVVFVENGGGLSGRQRVLPNGETSPHNLFKAIQELVAAHEPFGIPDLVGIHALRFVTGLVPCELTQVATLCQIVDGSVTFRAVKDEVVSSVLNCALPNYNFCCQAQYPNTTPGRWAPGVDANKSDRLNRSQRGATNDAMRRDAAALPRWDDSSEEVKRCYMTFFKKHETVLKLKGDKVGSMKMVLVWIRKFQGRPAAMPAQPRGRPPTPDPVDDSDSISLSLDHLEGLNPVRKSDLKTAFKWFCRLMEEEAIDQKTRKENLTGVDKMLANALRQMRMVVLGRRQFLTDWQTIGSATSILSTPASQPQLLLPHRTPRNVEFSGNGIAHFSA